MDDIFDTSDTPNLIQQAKKFNEIFVGSLPNAQSFNEIVKLYVDDLDFNYDEIKLESPDNLKNKLVQIKEVFDKYVTIFNKVANYTPIYDYISNPLMICTLMEGYIHSVMLNIKTNDLTLLINTIIEYLSIIYDILVSIDIR